MVHDQEKVIQVVKESFSYAECLRKLGKRSLPTNYYYIKNLIKKYCLDISHFCRNTTPKGQIVGIKIPTEEYLNGTRKIETYKLKNRLIKENLIEYKCSFCGITEWNGHVIPLELDHIDGNKNNNQLTNLRILCPNCHATTPTYKTKNSKYVAMPKEYFCSCGNTMKKTSKRCRSCMLKTIRKHKDYNYKIPWPSDEELKKLVWEKPIKHLSLDLQVSNTAIAKRCKKRNIILPPQGYWIKKHQ